VSKWLHLVIATDSRKRRIYINGKRVSNGVWHNIQRRMMRQLKRGER
jgi:hypothetical protein